MHFPRLLALLIPCILLASAGAAEKDAKPANFRVPSYRAGREVKAVKISELPIFTESPISPTIAAKAAAGAVSRVSQKAPQEKAALRQRAWQDFQARRGAAWTTRWDRHGRLRFAAGKAIPVDVPAAPDEGEITKASLDFVGRERGLFEILPVELKAAQVVRAGGRWRASFIQTWRGLPVANSLVHLSFTSENQVLALIAVTFSDIDVDPNPTFSAVEAGAIAANDARATAGASDSISPARLIILPRELNGYETYHLCWRLELSQPSHRKKWRFDIDAHTGKILGKADLIRYANVFGTVGGEYKLEYAADPIQTRPLLNAQLRTEGPEVAVADWNFDTDPGWSIEGLWQFGPPGGRGLFCPDPSHAYTGLNVYGYNLQGDYEANMQPRYLTTPPIDAGGYANLRLRFLRWLGVEAGIFDRASVAVSADGRNWTTLWQNPDNDGMCDEQWTAMVFDLPPEFDYCPTLQIRWALGPTDFSFQFCGWNIDDVRLSSVLGGSRIEYTYPDGYYSIPIPYKGGNFSSRLAGLYCAVHYALGDDAQFRQDPVRAGSLRWIWNARHYNVFDESNAYQHIDRIHALYKKLDPDFKGMDFPVPTTVYIDMENAYWDGASLNFGRGAPESTDNFSYYAEIFYHEYTHGVTDKIYGDVDFPYSAEPGAMNEGWSDYFACTFTPSQDPRIGEGGLVPAEPDGIRTLANEFRRETDWVNEVHVDSQMFSGALWQARTAVGAAVMDRLVHFARYSHALSYEDYLLALLTEDDALYGDNDPGNGTPHAEPIFTAFGRHGMGGLRYHGPSLALAEQGPVADGKLDPGETAALSLTLENNWAQAGSIRARLISLDPNLTIIKDAAAFADLPLGQSGNNQADPFQVSLSPDCPADVTLPLRLEIDAAGPYPYHRTCLIFYPVATRQLAYDDGQCDQFLLFDSSAITLAQKFTPAAFPCYLSHLRLFSFQGAKLKLQFRQDDGPGGSPGTLLTSYTASVPSAAGWTDVDITPLGLRLDQGSIYIGWQGGEQDCFLGLDCDPPYQDAAFFIFQGEIFAFTEVGLLGNPMLRVRYTNAPPIELPAEVTICPAYPVQACLAGQNGIAPYHWRVVEGPGAFNQADLGESLFTRSGQARGWHADDNCWSVELPFDFPFYGQKYRELNISSNGYIDFHQGYSQFRNSANLLAVNCRIAPLWDDLTTLQTDDIYLDLGVPNQATIRWAAHPILKEGLVEFALVLRADGSFRFDYAPVLREISPTIGVSAGTGQDYILLDHNDLPIDLLDVTSFAFTPKASPSPLPPGLELDSAGCIRGFPAQTGEYSVAVRVTDSGLFPQTAQKLMRWTVGYRQTDLAGDCVLDLRDFARLGENWLEDCGLENAWCAGADLNQDGMVAVDDLLILAGDWLLSY